MSCRRCSPRPSTRCSPTTGRSTSGRGSTGSRATAASTICAAIQAIGVDSMDIHFSDHGASTADKVHEREEFRLLVGDIHELPETQKTALVLREMDALSYEQIAEAMETTVPSVKSLLVRARVSLAEAAEARLLSCEEVRIELGEVAEGLRRRPSPLVRRHLQGVQALRVVPGPAQGDQQGAGGADADRPAGRAQEARLRPPRPRRRPAPRPPGAAGSSAAAGTTAAGTPAAGAAAAGSCRVGGRERRLGDPRRLERQWLRLGGRRRDRHQGGRRAGRRGARHRRRGRGRPRAARRGRAWRSSGTNSQTVNKSSGSSHHTPPSSAKHHAHGWPRPSHAPRRRPSTSKKPSGAPVAAVSRRPRRRPRARRPRDHLDDGLHHSGGHVAAADDDHHHRRRCRAGRKPRPTRRSSRPNRRRRS